MDRNDVRDTTRRVLRCLSERSLETSETAVSYSATAFTDPRRWDDERQRLFRDTPHVVAFASDLSAPDAYITREVAGVPVLITRGSDGELRAFLNVCSHRGAAVANGSGCAKRFTCGYHSWTYDGTGALVTLPARSMFAEFDRAELGLTPLPVSNEGGLIVVGLRPGVSTGGWLDDVLPAMAGYRFDECVPIDSTTVRVDANWKLTVDVNFEGYHFPAVRGASLNTFATGNASYDLYGRHCRWAFPMRHIEELRGTPEADWPESFVGTAAYFLFPSTVLVEAAGTFQLIRVYPGGHPGESLVDLAYATTHDAATEQERKNHLVSFEFVKNLLCNEDFPMAELCQRGMAAGLDRMIVGRNEPLIRYIHDLWSQAMDSSVPTPALTLSAHRG